ncbi:MAG: hypothetical protein HY664_04290 [Chloroflexi bacterium]|nr:hypothetical protein [Chloroflexota bacterium]
MSPKFRLIVIGIVLIVLAGSACRRPKPAATPTPTSTSTALATPTPSPVAIPSPTATPYPTPEATPTIPPELWRSGWPKTEARNEITALAIDPSNGQSVYAGTSAAIYLSVDGGESWTRVSSLPNLVAMVVDPRNGDTLYAYFWPKLLDAPQEPRGFRKSSDGGKTWSDPSGGVSAQIIGQATTLAIDPSNPATILVGTVYQNSYGRIFRSLDGGASWQVTYIITSVMGIGDMTAIAVHPTANNVVYAANSVYHGGVVVRSDDGGLSWRPLAPVPMPLAFPVSLALDPLDIDSVYVAFQAPMGGGANVYKTKDGGSSWSLVSDGLPIGASNPLLLIDPSDPKNMFISFQGSNGGVIQTTDGIFWTKLSPEGAPQFRHVTALGYSPAERKLYVGTADDVWQSTRFP